MLLGRLGQIAFGFVHACTLQASFAFATFPAFQGEDEEEAQEPEKGEKKHPQAASGSESGHQLGCTV